MGLFASILVLSFLIFFHEMGHFLAARYFGVKVETFSIGFGKKVYKRVIDGTEYCISAIPLGGYVKMKGQDDSDPTAISDDSDSYTAKPGHQRLVILFAGPFANFILAYLLYFAIALMGNQVLAPTIGEIRENSPAARSGLMRADKVVEINGAEMRSWDEMSKTIKSSEGAIELIVERDNRLRRIVINPEVGDSINIFREPIKKRMIGVSPQGDVTVVHYGLFEAFGFAWEQTLNAGKLIIQSIQKLIQGIVPTSEVGGVISIVQVTSEASTMGIVALFTFTALISVNLGILNLLPIPALDGGHIMFILYEMVMGHPPSETALYRLTIAGWVILFSLMFLGLYNDINRLMMPEGILQ